MTLRRGCSAEGVLKTVTSLKPEDGRDLDEHEVAELVGKQTMGTILYAVYTYCIYNNTL